MTKLIPKEFVTANRLLNDSFVLARKVYDAGYEPDHLIVLWRGGALVGMAMHELFGHVMTSSPDHSIIKAKSYKGIGERENEVKIENLDRLLDKIREGQKILIIDDIYDTGLTCKAMREALAHSGAQIKIAAPYYKPDNNKTNYTPDFYVKETKKWIVFPHEIEGLNDEEIIEKDPLLFELLKKN